MEFRHPLIQKSLRDCSLIVLALLFYLLLSVNPILTIGEDITAEAQNIDLATNITIFPNSILENPSFVSNNNGEQISKISSYFFQYCDQIQRFIADNAFFALLLFATYMFIRMSIWKSSVYGLEYQRLPIGRTTYYQAFVLVPLLGLGFVYIITLGILQVVFHNMPLFLKETPVLSIKSNFLGMLHYHWAFVLYLLSLLALMRVIVRRNVLALMFAFVAAIFPVMLLNWVDLLYRYQNLLSPLAWHDGISHLFIFYWLYKGSVFLRVLGRVPAPHFDAHMPDNTSFTLFCGILGVCGLLLLFVGRRLFLKGHFSNANFLSPQIKKGFLFLLPFVATVCCLYVLSRFYQIEAVLSFVAYLSLGFMLLVGFIVFSAKHWR